MWLTITWKDRYSIINVETTAKVIPGLNKSHHEKVMDSSTRYSTKSITNRSWTLLHATPYVWKTFRKNEIECRRKAVIRKAKFLAMCEAYKPIFWPSPGLNEATSDGFGFHQERTWTSTSSVSHCGDNWITERDNLVNRLCMRGKSQMMRQCQPYVKKKKRKRKKKERTK